MKATNRVWIAGCAGAAVLVAAGGYFLGVQPQLAHADETNANAVAVDAQTSTTQAKVTALSKVAAKQSDLEAKSVVLSKAVPTTLQANTFIRRVNTVAALDAVSVQSVTVGSATAYTQPKAIAAVAAAAVAAAAPTPTPTPGVTASADAAAVPVGPAAPVLAASDPAITGADFTVVPMTVVIKGTSEAGLQFVKDMQRDERLYLISQVSSAVDSQDASSVTTTLTGSVYAVKG